MTVTSFRTSLLWLFLSGASYDVKLFNIAHIDLRSPAKNCWRETKKTKPINHNTWPLVTLTWEHFHFPLWQNQKYILRQSCVLTKTLWKVELFLRGQNNWSSVNCVLRLPNSALWFTGLITLALRCRVIPRCYCHHRSLTAECLSKGNFC